MKNIIKDENGVILIIIKVKLNILDEVLIKDGSLLLLEV